MKDNKKLKDWRDRSKVNLQQPYERNYVGIKEVESTEKEILIQEFSKAKKVAVLETTKGIYALPYSTYLRVKSRLNHIKKVIIVDLSNVKPKITNIEFNPKVSSLSPTKIKPPEIPKFSYNFTDLNKNMKKYSVKLNLMFKGIDVSDNIIEEVVEKNPNAEVKELVSKVLEKIDNSSKLTTEKAVQKAKELYRLFENSKEKFYKKVKEEIEKIK